MTDVLKLARDRCDQLSAEASDLEVLAKSANYVIEHIHNFSGRMPDVSQDLENFERSSSNVLSALQKIQTGNEEEVRKLVDFIACGEELLASQGTGPEPSLEQVVEVGGPSERLSVSIEDDPDPTPNTGGSWPPVVDLR